MTSEPLNVSYRNSLWRRIFLGLTTFSAGLAGIVLCIICYWLFWPYQGLTSYHATILSPVVVSGGLLHGEIEYCVESGVPLPIRIDRDIILANHTISFPMTDLQYTITQRCERKVRMLGIPTYAPPGTYKMAVTTAIEVNPLRTIRQTWESPSFEVVAK